LMQSQTSWILMYTVSAVVIDSNLHSISISISISFAIAQTPTVRPRAHYIVITSCVIRSSMHGWKKNVSVLGERQMSIVFFSVQSAAGSTLSVRRWKMLQWLRVLNTLCNRRCNWLQPWLQRSRRSVAAGIAQSIHHVTEHRPKL